MILQVHRSLNLKKQLNILRKGGNRTVLVADHAQSVMEKLALAREWDSKQTGRRTRHGEARIKKCAKFDLIDGYRLIGIKEGQHLVFLYVGTHDECDRWIRNNTGPRYALREDDQETMDPKDLMFDISEEEEKDPESSPACDDYLLIDLDEKMLRKIFAGLTHQKS